MTVNALILSRDERWDGGVINVIASLKQSFSDDINLHTHIIGNRIGRRYKYIRYMQPVIDAFSLLKEVLFSGYDVIHINPSLNARSLLRDGFFMVILRFTRQNVMVFFHGWDEALASNIVNNFVKRFLMRVTFGYGDRVLVLADGFRQQLVHMGVSENKIFVTTTMFDGKQLACINRNGSGQGKRILFLSRFVREKGLFELVDAFARIAGEFPDALLTLAGDGPVRSELEHKVTELGLDAKVRFTGYVRGEEKVAVLQQADIFVLPTYYGEGCPVSLLEAMACGHALVSTAVGGIPDILIDGVNGVLLPAATPDLIYDALHHLLSSPEMLHEISVRNHETAWHKYEAKLVTAELERHYRAIAKQ